MAEDWDNLIILDACRFDMFNKQNQVQGNLEFRISKGSNTPEFFEKNFLNSTHYDTVYVSANPVPHVDKWCNVDVESVFYKTINVWDQCWDKDLNTVHPDPVATAIKQAHEEYPDKRILGHFIQPHLPFIGSIGEQIKSVGMRAVNEMSGQHRDSRTKVWQQLENGEVSPNRVWRGYSENLDIVLSHVEELCSELSGKTVITSDHGNLVGEFAWPFPVRYYGHPPGVHTSKLVKVPWLEINSETRRKTATDQPVDTETTIDKTEQLERLRDLGYY